VLTYLGHLYLAQSRCSAAADHFEAARWIARAEGNRAFDLETLRGLGWVRSALGEDAAPEFTEALAVARALGHHIGELHILRALGLVHRSHGRWGEAVDLFGQTLAMSRRLGSRNAELSAMVGIGWVYRLDGRIDSAADHYRLVLDVAREIGSREYEFEALQGTGRVHHVAGRPEQAFASHRAALGVVADRGPSAEHARVSRRAGRGRRRHRRGRPCASGGARGPSRPRCLKSGGACPDPAFFRSCPWYSFALSSTRRVLLTRSQREPGEHLPLLDSVATERSPSWRARFPPSAMSFAR
jgi:tetratricopeptide (TPR) repeat protein